MFCKGSIFILIFVIYLEKNIKNYSFFIDAIGFILDMSSDGAIIAKVQIAIVAMSTMMIASKLNSMGTVDI